MLNQKSFNDLVVQILTSICNQFEEYFMILGDPEIVLVEHNNWDPNIPMQVSEDGNQIDINLQGFYGLLEKEAKRRKIWKLDEYVKFVRFQTAMILGHELRHVAQIKYVEKRIPNKKERDAFLEYIFEKYKDSGDEAPWEQDAYRCEYEGDIYNVDTAFKDIDKVYESDIKEWRSLKQTLSVSFCSFMEFFFF